MELVNPWIEPDKVDDKIWDYVDSWFNNNNILEEKND